MFLEQVGEFVEELAALLPRGIKAPGGFKGFLGGFHGAVDVLGSSLCDGGDYLTISCWLRASVNRAVVILSDGRRTGVDDTVIESALLKVRDRESIERYALNRLPGAPLAELPIDEDTSRERYLPLKSRGIKFVGPARRHVVLSERVWYEREMRIQG